MNMVVYYKNRRYGTGDDVRHYSVLLSEISGLFVERPISTSTKCYPTWELELNFRARPSVAGIGDNPWSEAEVSGGRLTLSHDAALQLANTIIKFLDDKKRLGHADNLEIEINENPEPK